MYVLHIYTYVSFYVQQWLTFFDLINDCEAFKILAIALINLSLLL